jgi:hypothetical protein
MSRTACPNFDSVNGIMCPLNQTTDPAESCWTCVVCGSLVLGCKRHPTWLCHNESSACAQRCGERDCGEADTSTATPSTPNESNGTTASSPSRSRAPEFRLAM